MRIKYLGTAAAEGYPAMFCGCENCVKAAKLGGKNIRTRSQALIDDVMLIDFPCDTYYHLIENKINLLDIKHCLITHTHYDHFYPDDFIWLRKGFSHPPENWHGIDVYSSKDIEAPIKEMVENSRGFLSCIIPPPFKPFKVGDYTVTALKALHGPENPYIYIISKDDNALLYAHDTDFFPEETWEYLKNSDIKFNAVSLDCTEGSMKELPYKGHMCLGINIKCREEMAKSGLVDQNTKFILNHFSHNGTDSVYDDFRVIAEKEGFITSFDGMELEI